jgi:hypothetical protein
MDQRCDDSMSWGHASGQGCTNGWCDGSGTADASTFSGVRAHYSVFSGGMAVGRGYGSSGGQGLDQPGDTCSANGPADGSGIGDGDGNGCFK